MRNAKRRASATTPRPPSRVAWVCAALIASLLGTPVVGEIKRIPARNRSLENVQRDYDMNTASGAFLELVGRCLDAMSSGKPFNGGGLTPSSAEQIDYNEYGSRQTWLAPNRSASVGLHAYKSDDDKPIFSCHAETKWDADDATKDEIHSKVTAWAKNEVAARRLSVGEYDYKIRPQDITDVYNSVHGNARGCDVRFVMRALKFGAKYQMSAFFAMRTKPCNKPAVSFGAGL